MKESQNTEFKRLWKDEYLKWICGFANAEGGVLVIGRDDAGKHASKPFNPDVANAFFRAGLIELWGRGIERINQACLDGGFPVPEWKLETGGVWTIFRFSVSYLQAAQETTQETTQEKIVRLLKAEPSMTRQELAQQLDISADGIKYHLEKLKRSGKLKRRGSTKTGIWEVME
jgi:ATP-dependent DNA helicase RecG